MSKVKEAKIPKGVTEVEQLSSRMPVRVYNSEIIHIANRRAEKNNRSVEISQCNRVLDDTTVETDLDGFSLCHRCGTEDDFKAARQEHNRHMESWRQEYESRQRREAEARAEAYRQKTERTTVLCEQMRAHFDVRQDGARIYLTHESQEYVIEERNKSEEL